MRRIGGSKIKGHIDEDKGPKFFGVRKGLVPGVYSTWTEAKQQTAGYPGGDCQSFKTYQQAYLYSFPWKSTDAPDTTADPALKWAKEPLARPTSGLQRASQLLAWVDALNTKQQSAKDAVANEILQEHNTTEKIPTRRADLEGELVHLHVWLAVNIGQGGNWAVWFDYNDERNTYGIFTNKIIIPLRVRIAAVIDAVNTVLTWCKKEKRRPDRIYLYIHTESRVTLRIINGWVDNTVANPWNANIREDDKDLWYTLYHQLASSGIRFKCCLERTTTGPMRAAYKMIAERMPKDETTLQYVGWNATKMELIQGTSTSAKVEHVTDSLDEVIDLTEDTPILVSSSSESSESDDVDAELIPLVDVAGMNALLAHVTRNEPEVVKRKLKQKRQLDEEATFLRKTRRVLKRQRGTLDIMMSLDLDTKAPLHMAPVGTSRPSSPSSLSPECVMDVFDEFD